MTFASNRQIRRSLLLLTLLVSLSLFGCNVSQLIAKNASPELHVLFIGNSYTYFNNLPQIVSALADSAQEGRSLAVTMVTRGGATLQQHWQDGKALKAIRQEQWNYVVLQEHSTLGLTQPVNGKLPINDTASFFQYARLFDSEIKKAGAKTIFLMTWARQNAPETQTIISRAYRSIAQELKALLAPAGEAWRIVSSTAPAIALYQPDGSHPQPAGSYLTACVLYATLYNKSPVGLTALIQGQRVEGSGSAPARSDSAQSGGKDTLIKLDALEALTLQNAAWLSVREEKYSAGAAKRTAAPTLAATDIAASR
jgi:hypothetical protein